MLRAFFSCIQVSGQPGLHETYPWHSLVRRLYWSRRGTQHPAAQPHCCLWRRYLQYSSGMWVPASFSFFLLWVWDMQGCVLFVCTCMRRPEVADRSLSLSLLHIIYPAKSFTEPRAQQFWLGLPAGLSWGISCLCSVCAGVAGVTMVCCVASGDPGSCPYACSAYTPSLEPSPFP